MTLASLHRQRVLKNPIKIDVQNHHLEDKREGQRKAKRHATHKNQRKEKASPSREHTSTRTKERRELVHLSHKNQRNKKASPSPTRTKERRELVPLSHNNQRKEKASPSREHT
jgi:hypothetical protein